MRSGTGHIAVQLLGFVLLALALVACGGTLQPTPEPIPDVDAAVEARLKEERAVEATAQAAPQVVPAPALELARSPGAWGTLEDVQHALDKHTLSKEDVQLFPDMMGATGGGKYSVDPGGYQLEIYVYGEKDNIQSATRMIGAFAEVGDYIVERNVLLYVLYDDKVGEELASTYLNELVADLRD